MASLHLTTPSDFIKQKKSEEALKEVLKGIDAMRVDTGLSAQTIIDTASRSRDPKFIEIRDNWNHWTEFMNHVTSRFSTQQTRQEREQKLYQGGFNANAGPAQPQSTGLGRPNMVCYTCESPDHMSGQCPFRKELEAKGIAYYDQDAKQWIWGSKDDPEINADGQKVPTPGYYRGMVYSGIMRDHARRRAAGISKPAKGETPSI